MSRKRWCLFISSERIEGVSDYWAWEDLLAEDEKEYEELRRQGKIIAIDEEDLAQGDISKTEIERGGRLEKNVRYAIGQAKKTCCCRRYTR